MLLMPEKPCVSGIKSELFEIHPYLVALLGNISPETF